MSCWLVSHHRSATPRRTSAFVGVLPAESGLASSLAAVVSDDPISIARVPSRHGCVKLSSTNHIMMKLNCKVRKRPCRLLASGCCCGYACQRMAMLSVEQENSKASPRVARHVNSYRASASVMLDTTRLGCSTPSMTYRCSSLTSTTRVKQLLYAMVCGAARRATACAAKH
jgi:hypothetical protein